MSAEIVQQKIIDQLKADASITTEFGTNVSAGVGRNFKFNAGSRGIRVYLSLENFTRTTLPNRKQDAVYPFLMIIMFYEVDEVKGEERKTKYSKMVRVAIEKDFTLSGTVYDLRLGDTRYYFDPNIEGSYFLVVPLMAKKKEDVGI